jgi:hypothetical protein
MHTGGGRRRPFVDEDLIETLAEADNPGAEPLLTIENGEQTEAPDRRDTRVASDEHSSDLSEATTTAPYVHKTCKSSLGLFLAFDKSFLTVEFKNTSTRRAIFLSGLIIFIP